MIEQELGNLLPFERPFATLLTMVEVDPERSGVQEPDQVHRPGLREGRSRSPREGEELGLQAGRRQVAPRRAFARAQAHLRAAADQVAARAEHDRHRRRRRRHPDHVRARRRSASSVGIECVIDKDLATELLARELGADYYVMLTDADAVYRRLGQADAEGDPARLAAGVGEDAVRRRIDGTEGRGGVPVRGSDREVGRNRRARGSGQNPCRQSGHHDIASRARDRVCRFARKNLNPPPPNSYRCT